MLVYDWMWWGHLTNQKEGCMEGCTEGCEEGATDNIEGASLFVLGYP